MEVVHGTNHSEQLSCVYHNNDCVCVFVCVFVLWPVAERLYFSKLETPLWYAWLFLYPVLRVCGLQCLVHMLKDVAVLFCSFLHGI